MHSSSLKDTTHSIALLLGNLDNLGELDVATSRLAELVEDITQSATENTLNLLNLITGSDQVLQSLDDRQTRTDSRLAVE